MGVYAHKNVNEETDIMLGAYYRYKDAFAPFFGIDYKNFLMGVSYDMNASKLGMTTRKIRQKHWPFYLWKHHSTSHRYPYPTLWPMWWQYFPK